MGPKKPRAIWDGSYLNNFIRDIPFSMDNAAKAVKLAWQGACLLKLNHKNGYAHMTTV